MQKSMWNEIWLSYRLGATRLKLFREIFQRAELIFQVTTVASVLLFFGSLTWYFLSDGDIKSSLAVIVSEILMLYLMDQMKSRSFGQNFLFAGETHHRSPRFQIFKDSLKEKDIGVSEIRSHMDLLDAEIELSASGSGNGRRVAAFGVPLLVGLMVGIATSINDLGIVLVTFWISLGVFIIAYLLASTFRTQEESLRELKTFMNLYLIESSEIPRQSGDDQHCAESQQVLNVPHTTEPEA